jgi:hypothetical protein
MVINLWYNGAINEWRWTLSDPKNLDQHSGNRENIRDAMNDIANTVEHLRDKKGVNMELKKPTCLPKDLHK